MVIEIIVGSFVVAVTAGLAYAIKKAREASRLRELLVVQTEILPVPYICEGKDQEMIDACKVLVKKYFSEGIEANLKNKSLDDRKKMVEQLTIEASKVLDIQLAEIRFDESAENYGSYNGNNNTITFSEAYLAIDEEMTECINTIFHELKHAVQYKSLQEGGNVYGYSDETLVTWAKNFRYYIPMGYDVRIYVLQPIEINASGFAEKIVPVKVETN